MKTNASVNFYIPKAFDSEQLPASQRDAAHYLLNLIWWKQWRRDDGGFVRLNWKHLQRITTRPLWRPIRRQLEALGVIDVEKVVVVGKRSWGYRLAPNFGVVQKVVCTDPKLVRRIQTAYGDDSIRTGPIERWLKSKLTVLQLDAARAHAIIETLTPDIGAACTVGEYRSYLRVCADRLDADATEGFDRDRFGRVHSGITSLCKELRCCLSVAGEPLVAIDLKNSQPLFAGMLARQFYAASNKTRFLLLNRTFNVARRPRPLLAPPPASQPDVERYIELCERGEFYESFTGPTQNRDAVKKQMFHVLYGPNRYGGALKNSFERRFPSIALVLRRLKAKNYRRAAWVLQELESRVVIDQICGRLKQERPSIIVFTIHDSLLVLERDAAIVQQIIKDEFAQLRLCPKLSVERYEHD